MAEFYEVESILADRTRRGQTEFKIRWKKFGPKSDSWEPEENLVACADVLREYKAQKAAEAAPTPRRSSRRIKQTPAKPTPKPEASVTRSVKAVKFTEQKSGSTRAKKTTLKNDFVTPKPPRATIRQRVLELEESEESEEEVVTQPRSRHGKTNKRSTDETDHALNLKLTQSTARSHKRLQQLKDSLKSQRRNQSSLTTDDEGASWWIVALCVLCFLVVVGIIVWQSPVISKEVKGI